MSEQSSNHKSEPSGDQAASASEADSEPIEVVVVDEDGHVASEPVGDAANVDESQAEPDSEAAPEHAELFAAQQTITELEAQVSQLERDKKDHWNRLLRATADIENTRKRAKRDVEDARIDARSKVLKDMLPVIDNLERALDHAVSTGAGEDPEASAVIEGVRLVLRQFGQALERSGVTAVEARGRPFDPNVHEAISQVETTEYPAGSVAQVLQKGYMIGERLLRPSLVVVARAPAPPPEPSEPDTAGESPESSSVAEPPALDESSADPTADVEET